LIDTHAHLALLEKRGLDPHKTLEEAFAAGLAGLIDISLEPGDLPGRVREFSRHSRVRFASGLWPHAASIAGRRELVPALEREIRSVLSGGGPAGSPVAGEPLVCALGEFGLDHHYDGGDGGPDLAGERELMEAQLDLAEKLGLPVIIHSRDAPGETAEILAAHGGARGVVHCFSYGPEEARTFLDLGYFISFAGNLTYKNAPNIREACRIVPPDRLLLETDCPYLAPAPFRGKPAHPGMVAENYKLAAELRGEPPEEMGARIAKNVEALFGTAFSGNARA
jgi:TatD DNase family protein